jgi:hypothetical protein
VAKELIRRIRDEKQLQLLVHTLAGDLGRANDYLTLWSGLIDEQRRYWRAVAQAQTFWHVVRGALQDAGLQGLAKAYDDHRTALSLRTLLLTVESKPTFLAASEAVDIAQLNQDLEFVDHRTNPSVKHLMFWRNSLLAHRDAAKIIDGWTLSERAPLSSKEVRTLIDGGLEIVNRYSLVFFRSTTIADIHGHDDFLNILQIVHTAAERKHEEILQQIRDLGEAESS